MAGNVTLAGNQAQAVKLGIVQKTNVTNATAATNAVGARTQLIRVVVSVDSYIDIGPTATATTSSTYLPAFAVEYFRVEPNTDKVAALRVGASDGVMLVTECF